MPALDMNVLIPRPIDDGNFTACSVAEPDLDRGEVLWAAGTNWQIGEECIRVETHYVYTCTIAGVDATPPEEASDRWYKTRPTNKWAWCDYYRDTLMFGPSPLSITAAPGTATDIDIYGAGAESVRVIVKDAPGGAVVFDEARGLRHFVTDDPVWEFFFGDWITLSEVSFSNIYPSATCEVTIIFYGAEPGAEVSVGTIALGAKEPMGMPVYDFSAEPVYFGSFELDKYGSVVLDDQGRKAKIVRGSTTMKVAEARRVFDLALRLQGRPASCTPSPLVNYDYLRAFGKVTLKVNAAGPGHATANAEIEGFA